jgi:hypothetical protein
MTVDRDCEATLIFFLDGEAPLWEIEQFAHEQAITRADLRRCLEELSSQGLIEAVPTGKPSFRIRDAQPLAADEFARVLGQEESWVPWEVTPRSPIYQVYATADGLMKARERTHGRDDRR